MVQSRAQVRHSDERVSLYFNVTNACNSACVFCASDSQDATRHDIPTHVICAAFERFAVGPGDEIIINGGEPTIHPGLHTIIREGVERGAALTLFTNGRLLHSFDYTRALLVPGLFRISIPLYAHSEIVHDRVTCRPGSFQQTLQGIRNVFAVRSLTHYPTQIELKLLAVRPSLPEWARTVELLAAELGRPSHIVLSGVILSKSVLFHRDELIPSIAELHQHVNDALDKLWHLGIPVLLWAVPLCVLNDRNLARYCRMAWQLKHRPQEVHFDPGWKRHPSATACLRQIYFDPSYPDGVEPRSDKSPTVPEHCRECAMAAACDSAQAFFAEVIAPSSSL